MLRKFASHNGKILRMGSSFGASYTPTVQNWRRIAYTGVGSDIVAADIDVTQTNNPLFYCYQGSTAYAEMRKWDSVNGDSLIDGPVDGSGDPDISYPRHMIVCKNVNDSGNYIIAYSGYEASANSVRTSHDGGTTWSYNSQSIGDDYIYDFIEHDDGSGYDLYTFMSTDERLMIYDISTKQWGEVDATSCGSDFYYGCSFDGYLYGVNSSGEVYKYNNVDTFSLLTQPATGAPVFFKNINDEYCLLGYEQNDEIYKFDGTTFTKVLDSTDGLVDILDVCYWNDSVFIAEELNGVTEVNKDTFSIIETVDIGNFIAGQSLYGNVLVPDHDNDKLYAFVVDSGYGESEIWVKEIS